MKNAVGALIAIVLVALAAGVWWYYQQPKSESAAPHTESKPSERADEPEDVRVIDAQGAAIGDENLANFKCDNGKTITAVFERDIVGVTLSDGRQLVLRQAVSGSGIRYLSNDTNIEFRGKGQEGELIENGETTYKGCLASN